MSSAAVRGAGRLDVSERYDIAVIGAGIVGLSVARSLLRLGRYSVVVVEAESDLAHHQTGHNSGVIHSGLYYRPGSLKARNCLEGSRALFEYCRQKSIAHERCGKLVVATDPSQIPALDELERRGIANGLSGLERVAGEGIRAFEPHATGVGALWVPQTGIVEFTAVARAFAVDVRETGGEILFGSPVRAIHIEPAQAVLEAGPVTVRCDHLVNCAGLQSDRLARLTGLDPGLRIVPFRGEYYELVETKRHLVKNLVYPVPDARFPFLGVHLTRMIDGRREAGPNAVLALDRHGYKRWSVSPRDALDTLLFPGLWRLARVYARTAFTEIARSYSKKKFVADVRKLVPEIQPEDLERSGSGVRAQAVLPSGTLVDDFRILEGARSTHVLNAPSPAATASISIGESIVRRVLERLEAA